jgi:hypothetical protein
MSADSHAVSTSAASTAETRFIIIIVVSSGEGFAGSTDHSSDLLRKAGGRRARPEAGNDAQERSGLGEAMMESAEHDALRAAIETAKREYDRANPPSPDVLPRDQWQAVPDAGHRTQFTEEEVARAGELFVSPAEARAFARELYSGDDQDEGFALPEDLLSAMSLLSDALAERVRALLNESHEQARVRTEEFLARLARWHAEGSPHGGFPDRSA